MKKFIGMISSMICFAFIVFACSSGGSGTAGPDTNAGGGGGGTSDTDANGGGGGGSGGGNDSNNGNSGGGGGEEFWTDFLAPDQGCVAIGTEGAQICGPWKVRWAELVEPSTGEFLGSCDFSTGDKVSTGPGPGGYEFWCERQMSGGNTTIKVTSEQANLLILRANIIQDKEQNAIPWGELDIQAAVVNRSDGTAYSDPYAQKDFKFAGAKEFTFNSSVGKPAEFYDEHAVKPFVDAGYSAARNNYQATSNLVTVRETLDGRALLQDKVESLWKLRSVKGNTATYDYIGKYQGTTRGVMTVPYIGQLWEINVNATFEYDPNNSAPDAFVFNTTGGTVTQIMYTVPNTSGGMCYGVPDSFTDTFPIAVGDGYLNITRTGTPLQYDANATTTSTQTHTYQECCSNRTPSCEDKVLDPQSHAWIFMGNVKRPAEADGSLQGTYTEFGLPTWEWNLTPSEN